MKAKAYKVEILVLDPENCRNEDDVKYFLENVKYLYPKVKSIQSREIEWDDDHPLNHTQNARHSRLLLLMKKIIL
jgi:hypothetical protein